jgi:serine/threonine protein kinase
VYTLLTGRAAFPGAATESMARRQVEGVPAPSAVRPEVPREIDAIVQKMAAREPGERYQSADELLVALHPWLPVALWQSLGIDPARFAPAEGFATADRPTETTRGWRAVVRKLWGG